MASDTLEARARAVLETVPWSNKTVIEAGAVIEFLLQENERMRKALASICVLSTDKSARKAARAALETRP